MPDLPEPNAGFMAFADRDSLVVAGGTHWEGGQKNWLDSLHFWNPGSPVWHSGRMNTSAAYAIPLPGGFLGGSDGIQPIKALFSHEGEKTEFLPLPALPDNLVLAAGGLLKSGAVIVSGGTSDAADLSRLSVKTFILQNDGPVFMPDFPGPALGICGSVVVNDCLYLLGGAQWDKVRKNVVNSAEIWCFSAKERKWARLTTLPYPVRGLTAVHLGDEWIYLAGGFRSAAEGLAGEEGFTDQAFLFSTSSHRLIPARPLPVRAMVTLLVHQGYLYCLGGEDQPRSRLRSCFRIPVHGVLP